MEKSNEFSRLIRKDEFQSNWIFHWLFLLLKQQIFLGYYNTCALKVLLGALVPLGQHLMIPSPPPPPPKFKLPTLHIESDSPFYVHHKYLAPCGKPRKWRSIFTALDTYALLVWMDCLSFYFRHELYQNWKIIISFRNRIDTSYFLVCKTGFSKRNILKVFWNKVLTELSWVCKTAFLNMCFLENEN